MKSQICVSLQPQFYWVMIDPALEHTLATFSGQESLLWGLSYIYWSLENILL